MTVQAARVIFQLTIRILRSGVLALVLVNSMAAPAVAQQCPKRNPTGPIIASEVRSLEGALVFHDGIRQWFELKLDEPQCEQPSIQLVRGEADWSPLEVLRGCRVRATGRLDFSGTGYYSLDVFQSVKKIAPVGACARQLLFPDYSKAKPEQSIREYRVEMHVNYSPGDHPIDFRVSSAGRALAPWQAYASYMLTGGFVLYGQCGKGFAVDEVFGTPEADPSHFVEPHMPGDMAMFDPESAAAAGKKDLHLGFTCVRTQ